MLDYIAWTLSPEHFFHAHDAGYLQRSCLQIKEQAFAFICQLEWAANVNSIPHSSFWQRYFVPPHLSL